MTQCFITNQQQFRGTAPIESVAKKPTDFSTLAMLKLIFPNYMEKKVSYLGYFSISFEKIMFYKLRF